MEGHTAISKKAAAVSLAIIASVGFWWVTAGRGASAKDTVYTVPQVLASLQKWRGRTVLVRGVLEYAVDWGFHPMTRPCQPCRPSIYFLQGSFPFGKTLVVMRGRQDPVLAALRQVHVLPPFPPLFPGLAAAPQPRVYRVQLTPTCTSDRRCASAILLDALR
jgi:hypothetical protein